MHENKLMQNLAKLQELESKAGVHILHTLKSFNQASVLPIISEKLSGMSIASPKELTMAKGTNAKHLHLYAPAFKSEQLESMIDHIDTISFNSLNQWNAFKSLNSSKGLRINPKLKLEIPSHCNPNLEASRLGLDSLEFIESYRNNQELFKELEGLHFHALFQSSELGVSLLLNHIVLNYQEVLPQIKWLNLGGGHNFTSVDYKIDSFCKEVDKFKKLYPNIELYFEPGESVTKGCGEFVTTVLDIVNVADKKVVILDTSVETHLLDVAIVNVPLKVRGTQNESTAYFYVLAGNSCLQGDIIGEYFFKEEVKIGDKIIFENMMAYSLVKMTEFNGMEKAKFYLA